MDIILIRHGETSDNIKGIYGQDSTGLSKEGRKQIYKTKEKLVNFKFEEAYNSPLRRARETADILDLETSEKEVLREYDFGIFTGYSYNQILNKFPKETKKWIENPLEYKIPEGDRMSDLYLKIETYLEKLLEKDKSVVLVSHAGIIQLALAWVFDDYSYIYRFQVDNGSISVISINDGYKYISKLNY